jgi:putative FmdB family regulatory protein
MHLSTALASASLARFCRRFAMPTYEYRCEQCGEKFEHAEHISEHPTAHPACPKCGSEKVQHLPTPFVAKTSRKS